MKKPIVFILSALALITSCSEKTSNEMNPTFKPENVKVENGILTPEILWSMGRIGNVKVSPDHKKVLYTITYPDIKKNSFNSDLIVANADGTGKQRINTKFKGSWSFSFTFGGKKKVKAEKLSASNHISSPNWRPDGKKITFLSKYNGDQQLYEMQSNGKEVVQITDIPGGIKGYKYSPDMSNLLLIKDIKLDETPNDIYSDLPKANARIEDDLMYRHWDSWHDYKYSHILVAPYQTEDPIVEAKDIMEGERYDTPLEPFGGMDQITWTPDGKKIAYTCKKLSGKAYALSTNSDIYLYDLGSGETKNLTKDNPGYDKNPVFSPDGLRMAWESMPRDGYEADKNRLMIKDMETGKVIDFTANFDQDIHNPVWNLMGDALFFISNRHATEDIYRLNLPGGDIHKITEGEYNYTSVIPAGGQLISTRMSMSMPTEIYSVNPVDGTTKNISEVNRPILNNLKMGNVEKRWITTSDGKEMLTWVIYPPNFNPEKKYPTLLYCQGGPQSSVSQFWSYRWNFQMMAANDYIVVAPNRRGLPGFGREWTEQISGDYGGLNMQDYLSAIDTLAKESYVDENNLGAIGASYGGYSVYWLAGNHDKRFSAFISHCGVFNQEMMYTTTEEMFFVNWDLKKPYWEMPDQHYDFSPHLFVKNWDTPILVIHGAKDFRIPYTQGMGAFNAARLRDVPARFLFFPEENHWVLTPQNGILWQREFKGWLNKWLKDN
ncbi:S9 family peptidase [Marinilabilia rubra]|uniref:Peptidase S9 n=1 Tax=Marinilabilia rubra TaxID=2162893 RepID=A0A2U2B7B5_9BACT|nr:S9 family peptidase [Marinilabilia rubra]PWD98971.1 peptidase S9 [Marinilabilia rubra]